MAAIDQIWITFIVRFAKALSSVSVIGSESAPGFWYWWYFFE